MMYYKELVVSSYLNNVIRFNPPLEYFYSSFVNLKVHGGLYLIYLTLHVRESVIHIGESVV